MLTINHLQGYAFAKKKGDRIDVFEGPHTIGDFIPVIAEGSDVPRMLKDRFADVVSVKDFGAKGDGVTDDTEAIQAAVDTTKSIFFPPGKYRVTSTITTSAANGSRSFFGIPQNTAAEDSNFNGSVILCEVESGHVFRVKNAHAFVHDLGFRYNGSTSNINLTALMFKKDDSNWVQDIDFYVDRCTFWGFGQGIEGWGRCPTVTNNLFVGTSIGLMLKWPESDIYTSPVQVPPYANRSVRIIGNRKHGLGLSGIDGFGSLIVNDGDILRSAIIRDNICDIGSTILYDKKGVDSCIISGNVSDLGQLSCLRLEGECIYNCIIDGNNFSFRSSKVPNEAPIITSMHIFRIGANVVDGLTISNNLFQGFGRRAIGFNADNLDVSTYKDISITSNIFDFSNVSEGSGISCACFATPADNVSFVGNIITGSEEKIAMIDSAIFSFGDQDLFSNLNVFSNSLAGVKAINNMGRLAEPFGIVQFTPTRTLLYSNKSQGIVDLKINEDTSCGIMIRNDRADLNSLRIGFGFSDTNAYIRMLHEEDDFAFYSENDDSVTPNLGTPSHPWGTIYATNSTINTSDYRLKQDIANPADVLLKAWGNVGFKVFKYKDAVEKKGESNARYHVGAIAQDVQNAFTNLGLDASKFGLFCHDEWQNEYETVEVIDQEEVLDAEGNVVTPEQKHTEQRLITAAGDRYGIRYEEALALECAYLRNRLSKIETALATHGITLGNAEA